jgi:hypothetical protein
MLICIIRYKGESEQRGKKILEQADLLVATNKDLEELREINKKLKAEVDAIREELNKEKDKSTRLEKRLNDQDALIHAHDLARLYIYYYVEPYLGGKLWSQVAPILSDKISEREDNVITEDEFNTWTKTTFPAVSIPVKDLQDLNQARHSITHTYVLLPFLSDCDHFHSRLLCRKMQSIASQQAFLNKMAAFTWPSDFPFLGDVTTMTNILHNSTNLERISSNKITKLANKLP